MGDAMRRIVLVATGLATLAGAAGRTEAGLLLDQQNVAPVADGFTSYPVGRQDVQFGGQFQLAQTFAVGISGNLARIEIEVYTYGANVPLVVDIFRTTSGGTPDLAAGSLANFIVPASSVPYVSLSIPPFVALDLGAAAFGVAVGDVLALAVSAPGSIYTGEYYWVVGPDSYPSGEGFRRASSSAAFVPTIFNQGVRGDFGFRTYVDVAAVPEPSTLVLGSMSVLVGLGCWWRRLARAA